MQKSSFLITRLIYQFYYEKQLNIYVNDISSFILLKIDKRLISGKFVVRDCAGPEISKTGCTVKTVENQEVKVCVSTCSTDGCNGAPWIISAISVFVICVLGNILLISDIT